MKNRNEEPPFSKFVTIFKMITEVLEELIPISKIFNDAATYQIFRKRTSAEYPTFG